MDPKPGDRLLFKLKGKGTEGIISKRMGVRLRVEHSGGFCWAELKDVVEILPAQDPDSATAPPPADAAPTPLEAVTQNGNTDVSTGQVFRSFFSRARGIAGADVIAVARFSNCPCHFLFLDLFFC